MARKILLADDSVTAQNMGRKILADAGYEVVTVNNGSAALKKIAELKPDLAILDVYMPGYSGLEVCQRLKESQESSRIPVLLTVGKLEPFKPEEAHRVRAEGFIVKPFEASELLAALSKLEDKVVPRAEPSKPGRFARAIAAAEEAGRISRNDSTGDDNGWKSRISFPHKKTAEEKADEAPVYNPVNRDLRTVVETPAEKIAETAAQVPERAIEAAADTNVDVAALASAGLPKDVTPEEVAAIAAAAAQIQIVAATTKESAGSEGQISASTDGAADATAPSAQPEIASDSREDTAVGGAATADGRREGDEKLEESLDVPVTMAVATESMVAQSTTSSDGSSPRWSAVAVALEGDEATISLDQEMQRAYAAFVAEETASAPASEKVEAAPAGHFSAPADSSLATPLDAISNPEPETHAPESQAQETQAQETQAQEFSHAGSEPSQIAESAAAPEMVAAEPESHAELATSIPQPEPASIAPIAEEFAPAEPPGEMASPIAESTPEPVVERVDAAVEGAAVSPAPESEPAVVEPVASSHAFAPIVRSEPETQDIEKPKEDFEAVKSTAAAWASWRQIRDAEPAAAASQPANGEAPVATPAEGAAAMAVAAGAEQNNQGSPSAENPSDVASIVDSVLADLRPRLMAEITRKMAEKK